MDSKLYNSRDVSQNLDAYLNLAWECMNYQHSSYYDNNAQHIVIGDLDFPCNDDLSHLMRFKTKFIVKMEINLKKSFHLFKSELDIFFFILDLS